MGGERAGAFRCGCGSWKPLKEWANVKMNSTVQALVGGDRLCRLTIPGLPIPLVSSQP